MADQQGEQKKATAAKRRGLEAVAHFEVVAEHDPNVVNGPAEGTVHLRAVHDRDAGGTQIVFPPATTIVHRGRGAKVGQRYALRLPLERVGAAAADEDDGDGDE